MDRVLITGCGGMSGKAFYNKFSKDSTVKATDININEHWLSYLDVRDLEEYMIEADKFKPNVIIHLAALTDLEYCEENQENAYLTNVIGAENSVIVAKELQAKLVYISTAGIFDGEKEEYDDWDTPNPLNVYGRSKYLGEKYVVDNYDKYYVCRAGWMMGGGESKDKKFVKKIIEQINNGKKELYVVDDKLGTPTYTKDFANNIYELIKTNYFGVYNMVCEGDGSRFDVAKEILEVLNLTNEIKLTKVDSNYFKNEYFAQRPSSEKLINKKLMLRNLNRMGNWKQGLYDYLKNDYYDYVKTK
ncbi:NAD(P)-dependent oxidoreductase [Paenibacillus silvae]|uniref:dTDP-4-dehydrorhamnose reductase n=1 Tax=Paenibacillus silvae TaxID=1325358 RepID=A0ABQ1ZDL3_9BACL|nr:NAD(P)-dependent oxidoreductase [Paenibacillus silvae]GGH58134.1 NAD(P)-dependent oxidoreductase [Paenibacillus silvae]